jgi:hypothetical protein
MNCIDLIVALSKLPPDMEVVYEVEQTEDGFKMVVVEDMDEIITDEGVHLILLNPMFDDEDMEE